jgi:Fic family protein
MPSAIRLGRWLLRSSRWPRARRLDALIGAALATRPTTVPQTSALRARAAGKAYDHRRVAAFESLVHLLEELQPAPLPALPEDAARRDLLPFYEAYFSNYIEGTEFTLDEAAKIVFEGEIPQGRPRDAHDVIGTYRIVADSSEMERVPSSQDAFVELLTERHRIMLEARPDKHPGEFKTIANRAGSSVFVDPDLTEATLRAGFDAGAPLVGPFARAAYLMFIVTEVHPFEDGNGRIARVMMNAELVHGGEVRIIVPTVYRNNYLAALKGATHNGTYESLVDVLRFAQRYTARVDFSSRQSAERDLARTNATRDPTEAEQAGVRLTLP